MQPKPPSNPGRRKFLIAATSIVGKSIKTKKNEERASATKHIQ